METSTPLVVVYTKPYCGYCVAVKHLLRAKQVPFEEHHLTDTGDMLALKRRFGFQTFPMVVMNGTFVGGFRETSEAFRSGRALELLGLAQP